jgi:tetratricopeptide (TPR) repeat protein
LELSKRLEGEAHPGYTALLVDLGNATAASGDSEGSIRLFERAIEIQEALLGSDHPQLASALNNLANVQAELERYDDATTNLNRALEIFERAYGKECQQCLYALTNLANIAIRTGHAGDAIALLDRAKAESDAQGGVQPIRPRILFLQAQALWEAEPDEGRDRERARQLALEAREAMAASPIHDPEMIDAWLGEHLESSHQTVGEASAR